MCHGSLEPRHLMREMEARLAPALRAPHEDTPARAAGLPGLRALWQALRGWAKWKEIRHV